MRAKPRILAIDDDDLILESLKSELGSNYDLTTVQRAKLALDMLEEQSFECVISDVRMPGMDGVTFLKEVGNRYPFMGRILITAYSDSEATNAAMYERGVFKVSKPWRDELEIAVRRSLELRNIQLELDTNLQRFYRSVELERQFRQQTNPLIIIEQALSVITKLDNVLRVELNAEEGGRERCLAIGSDDEVRFVEKQVLPKTISLTQSEARFERQDMYWNYFVPLWQVENSNYNLKCVLSSLRQEELSWIDFVVEQLVDAMEKSVLVQEVEHHRQLADNSHGQLSNMEKMASLGLLSAGVAHEINNPAAYVRANLSVMEDYLIDLSKAISSMEGILEEGDQQNLFDAWQEIKINEQLDQTKSELQEMLVETREGVERIIDIAVNLKSFARRSTMERKRVGVQKCLETSITMMMYRYKHGLQIVREFHSSSDVLGTSAEYSQVFLNLLLNAAQAMNGHGTITVNISSMDGWVCVKITDDGPGIDPHHLQHIFEPLFTTKEYGEGTGLGLSITKEILERNGGKIEAKSKMGEGASFSIFLPPVDAA
jgi:signal transduction histidine kinase